MEKCILYWELLVFVSKTDMSFDDFVEPVDITKIQKIQGRKKDNYRDKILMEDNLKRKTKEKQLCDKCIREATTN